LAEFFGGNRKASVSRELSKLYEENIRGTLSELAAHYQTKAPKGEIVLVVAGKPKREENTDEEENEEEND